MYRSNRRFPPPSPRGGTSLPAHTSLVMMFDELTRNTMMLTEGTEAQFLEFATSHESCHHQCEAAEQDLGRVRGELEKCKQEVRKLEMKLRQARDLLSVETTLKKRMEEERDMMQQKWGLVRELIGPDQGGQTMKDDTRMRLQKLEASISSRRDTSIFSQQGGGVALSTVNEIDSTCSIVDASDLSFDNTQGSMMGADESRRRSGRPVVKRRSGGGVGQAVRQEKLARPSAGYNPSQAVAAARRLVDDCMLAARPTAYDERNIDRSAATLNPAQPSTTTLTPSLPSTTSLVSTSPYISVSSLLRRASSNVRNIRKHKFVQKNCFRTETCVSCERRIKFGKVCLKCVECRALAHPDCEALMPLPCVPAGQKTPTSNSRVLADFTPHSSPMVPGLVVHCINEVESRGLTEVGLYRVSGSHRQVKDLMAKFLASRGCPNLRQVGIHVLCSTIKYFLRSLREPLIPHSMWVMFTQAADNPDSTHGESELYQAISELPKPNRDTVAFLMLHLQKVAANKECNMNVSNLSKILGPTVVGYSRPEPQPEEIKREARVQAVTMARLILLDEDYWDSFISRRVLH